MSSVDAHFWRHNDSVITVASVLKRYRNNAAFLNENTDKSRAFRGLHRAKVTGHLFSNNTWLKKPEKLTGRQLKTKKARLKKEGA